MTPRFARLAAAGAMALLTPLPALAATGAVHAEDTVGGALLGSHGTVYDRSAGLPAPPAGIDARSWVVADVDTGAVLGAHDAHGRFLPASTLKTLTAVTLIPRLDPRLRVRPTFDDVNVDGSKVGLVPDHPYTVRTLFTAMLVVSGNDAANTLATAAGGKASTLALMNAEARHLQAYDTHAGTPSGLDARGESSSAYDLALIARAGLAMPAFRHYVATVLSHVPAPHHKRFEIYTHDRLLTSYRGAIGVKNGYTVAAQGTYVGAATRHGRTLVVTLMHANPNFWPMAKKLLDWGFAVDGRATPVGVLVGPATSRPDSERVPVALALGRDATSGAPATSTSGMSLRSPVVAAGFALVSGVVIVFGYSIKRRSRRRRRLRLPIR